MKKNQENTRITRKEGITRKKNKDQENSRITSGYRGELDKRKRKKGKRKFKGRCKRIKKIQE